MPSARFAMIPLPRKGCLRLIQMEIEHAIFNFRARRTHLVGEDLEGCGHHSNTPRSNISYIRRSKIGGDLGGRGRTKLPFEKDRFQHMEGLVFSSEVRISRVIAQNSRHSAQKIVHCHYLRESMVLSTPCSIKCMEMTSHEVLLFSVI